MNDKKCKPKTTVLFNDLNLREPICEKLHGFPLVTKKREEYPPLFPVHEFKVLIQLCGKNMRYCQHPHLPQVLSH